MRGKKQMGTRTMQSKIERKSATTVYDAVSRKDGLLYHIAHARKENSGDDYKSERLQTVAANRLKKDIKLFRESVGDFKEHSVPRT